MLRSMIWDWTVFYCAGHLPVTLTQLRAGRRNFLLLRGEKFPSKVELLSCVCRMWGSWEHLSPRRNAANRFVSLWARCLCKSNVWRIYLWFHSRRFVLAPWLPINLENNNSWSKPSENTTGRIGDWGCISRWSLPLQYHCTFYTPRQPGHLISQNSNWETDIVCF